MMYRISDLGRGEMTRIQKTGIWGSVKATIQTGM